MGNLSRIKVGENLSGIQDRSRYETRMGFASLSGRKAAQVPIWIEDRVSGEFEKLPNIGFASFRCLITSFGGTNVRVPFIT